MNWSEVIIFISALGFWAYLLIKIIDWFVEWDGKRTITKMKSEFEALHETNKQSSDIKWAHRRIDEIIERIEKPEQFKIDSELSLPIVADRLEKLEKRRK